MTLVWTYGPDDLLEEPGHQLIMRLDAQASAEQYSHVPLNVGTCTCGGMTPTPPEPKQSVGWDFNAHIEEIREETAKQSRAACLARNDAPTFGCWSCTPRNPRPCRAPTRNARPPQMICRPTTPISWSAT
ncbi:hypothetical protein [Nonomuraea sp. GTA35]|uniref:hypothetical protein n=1 Tax=Nonomuraea sp. GTA35 TaxID=1676746 RepID=UPI0035C09286